jgi:hypothetical protein
MTRAFTLLVLLVLFAPGPCLGQGLPQEPGFGGRMIRFGGAITASQYTLAKLEGDPDRAQHALTAPADAAFIASLAMFDTAMRLENRMLRWVPERGAWRHVKHNLVMAGAMTVMQMVEVDLGGFGLADAVRLDVSKLKHARVRFHGADPLETGLVLGAFSAAHALWTGSKYLLRRFGGLVAKRFLKTAAVKGVLAVAPVPGSRIGAALLTVADVALAIGDAYVLFTAAELMLKPVERFRSRLETNHALAENREALGGLLDRQASPAEIAAGLRAVGDSFRTHRGMLYLPAWEETRRFNFYLRRQGVPLETLNGLYGRSLRDFGQGELVLPAFGQRVVGHYQALLGSGQDGEASAVPGGDRAAFAEELEGHRARLARKAGQVGPSWRTSFAEEKALYLDALERAQTPAARALIEEALANLDVQSQFAGLLVPSSAADEARASDTTTTQADRAEPGGRGAADALESASVGQR